MKEMGWDRLYGKEEGYGAYIPSMVLNAGGATFDYPDIVNPGDEYLIPKMDQVSNPRGQVVVVIGGGYDGSAKIEHTRNLPPSDYHHWKDFTWQKKSVCFRGN
jgi:hypothetical protein